MDVSEQNFEGLIEAALSGGDGRRAAEAPSSYGEADRLPGYRLRKPTDYDRARCLDPDMLFDFIRITQASTWEKLKEQHGEHARERFLKRLVAEIEARGTLDVLRKGMTDLGCKFQWAHFRPETGLNEEHLRLYRGNVFSVVRQLRYSDKNENSIDLVLFLNGLPLFTAELKNPAKNQTVEHAIWQYKKDRDPKEPLLRFGRCLAHFAVDTDLVYMTTRLDGRRSQGGSAMYYGAGGAGVGVHSPARPTGIPRKSCAWARRNPENHS